MHWNHEYHPTPFIRAVQWILLILIIVGIVLLLTQTLWLAKLTSYLLSHGW